MTNLWAEESLAKLDEWSREFNVADEPLARLRAGLTGSLTYDRPGAAPGQEPELFIPGLRTQAWWDRSEFPWLPALENSYSAILQEMHAVSSPKHNETIIHPSGLADIGNWNAYYFYYVGEPDQRHLQESHRTAEALENVPGIKECGMTYFSVMDPKSHIESHCGFLNAHLRCHLALEIPSRADCRMRVGDEVRSWEEGKAFVFDDTFSHEVWNDSEQRRVVLLFDTWHPDLTGIEVEALSVLVNVWRRRLYRETLVK